MKNLNDIFSGMDEVLNNAKKGNFEDVLNKTRTYAKKSAEAIEISRKKIEVLDAKAKLAKAYENLGKLQYSVIDGIDVNQGEIDAAVDEITLLKNRMQFLEDEIEAFKDEIAANFDAKMSVSKQEDVVVDDVEVIVEPSDE